MKIITKAMAGSHLFGTSTPSSDKDYKGVFIPSAEEILLGTYKDGFNSSTGNDDSRNGKDDIDVELYSLRKFFKMIRRGDTAALELLFTPDTMVLEKDPIWDEILLIRDSLLSSRVSAMIGYARQQANKYGIKGSRMGELNNVIKVLKEGEKLAGNGPKIKHAWQFLVDELKGYEHVHFITLYAKSEDGPEIPALDILGKKFDHHCKFSYILEVLKRIYKNYGQRAREAKKNNGIDWKALSHATRVSLQGIELLETGKITLPLSEENTKLVKDIKLGKMDYSDVQVVLEGLLAKLESSKEGSVLPERVSEEFTDKLIIKYHKRILNA